MGISEIMTPVSRGSQLRALKRLLDYALAESQDIGLAHLDKLLGAAALAVGDELDNVKVLSPKAGAIAKGKPLNAGGTMLNSRGPGGFRAAR